MSKTSEKGKTLTPKQSQQLIKQFLGLMCGRTKPLYLNVQDLSAESVLTVVKALELRGHKVEKSHGVLSGQRTKRGLDFKPIESIRVHPLVAAKKGAIPKKTATPKAAKPIRRSGGRPAWVRNERARESVLKVGDWRITVHTHLDEPEDKLFVTCYRLGIHKHPLRYQTIAIAEVEALQVVAEELARLGDAFRKAAKL